MKEAHAHSFAHSFFLLHFQGLFDPFDPFDPFSPECPADFTPCFENTVVRLLPAVFFVAAGVPRYFNLSKHASLAHPSKSWRQILKLVNDRYRRRFLVARERALLDDLFLFLNCCLDRYCCPAGGHDSPSRSGPVQSQGVVVRNGSCLCHSGGTSSCLCSGVDYP